MRPQESIHEFHAGAQVPEYSSLKLEGRLNRLALRKKLIREEVQEALDELERWPSKRAGRETKEMRASLAKELADILVVVYGTADELGIPLDDVYEEVMASNMTKLVNPKFREDGKLLKGDSYEPPDLGKFF